MTMIVDPAKIESQILEAGIPSALALIACGKPGVQTDHIAGRIRNSLHIYIAAIANDTLSGREESRDEFHSRGKS